MWCSGGGDAAFPARASGKGRVTTAATWRTE